MITEETSNVIVLPTLHCLRCEHSWTPRTPEMPKVCPKCKTPKWNIERTRKRRTVKTKQNNTVN